MRCSTCSTVPGYFASAAAEAEFAAMPVASVPRPGRPRGAPEGAAPVEGAGVDVVPADVAGEHRAAAWAAA